MKPHPFDGGIDLHARSLDVCIVHQAGAVLLHRHMQAAPAPVLKAITPDREGIVGAVEGLLTWQWLADRCAQEGIAVVLGQALSMKALHGGNAQHETIASQKLALVLRGGMRPQAYVYPAPRRATRDR